MLTTDSENKIYHDEAGKTRRFQNPDQRKPKIKFKFCPAITSLLGKYID